MAKVLILPLLKMPSGHHQVAEALMHKLKCMDSTIEMKKVDLISYTSGMLEKIVTKMYLNWIQKAPRTYQWVYKHFIYADADQTALMKLYELSFIKQMEKLIAEENPDLVICTHSFPSMLLSRLKSKGKIDVPVINAYTDFFVNGLWGKKEIDIHFVPNQTIKTTLICNGVPEQNIFVTGIPIHEAFKERTALRHTSRKKILISGGSSGLGDLYRLLKALKREQPDRADYYVLCGKNKKLYHKLNGWGMKHIIPVPYIQSRKEMSRLYDEADAIITKPGGVTISEVIQKKLPIFIHSVLPGQEEINLAFLKQHGLVFELDFTKPVEEQVMEILEDGKQLARFYRRLRQYGSEIELQGKEFDVLIRGLLGRKANQTPDKVLKDQYFVSTSY